MPGFEYRFIVLNYESSSDASSALGPPIKTGTVQFDGLRLWLAMGGELQVAWKYIGSERKV